MSLELWEKILNDCVKNGHYVNWVHHLGEPLLWKHFKKGMEMWRESGLSTYGHISTNGILLDEEKLKIIKETGIDFIRICIDTLKPDVYKLIRNNDKHRLVIENIRSVLDNAPELNVQIQLMRTKLNEDETPENCFDFFGRRPNLSVFYTTAMEVGKSYDFKLIEGERINPKFCNKVDYEHCIIGWDGSVGLCCVDYWLKNSLGNINDATISEIFDGEYANKVRNLIKQGDFSLSPACYTCAMDHMKPMTRKLIGYGERVISL